MSAPVVFGYIRLSRPDNSRLELLRGDIREFCIREGLALDLVFADSGVNDIDLVRPGWTALIDALAQANAYAVVVPTLDHLSRDPVLRAELRAQITQTGATICLMPPATVHERDLSPAE